MYDSALTNRDKVFAVAPMMDWTDQHCRFFHRQFTKRALLYTEMVVADALIHGDAARHLDFDAAEHPVALQLGGSDPSKLAEACRIASDWNYDEINLNVGCPSDRVQSGTFGACLMREPDLVARCVEAMKRSCDMPVTVKCRIGVDEQDTGLALDNLANAVFAAGCDALWVHARKAWLEGLSPKENRDIPPLKYDRVRKLKRDNPAPFIGINGGITTIEHAQSFVAQDDCLDGVMLGRAAYQTPDILAKVDSAIYADAPVAVDYAKVCDAMCDYAQRHIARGGRLNHVTRHMVGLFSGQPGARRYRQILSVESVKPGAGTDVIRQAFAAVDTSASIAA